MGEMERDEIGNDEMCKPGEMEWVEMRWNGSRWDEMGQVEVGRGGWLS